MRKNPRLWWRPADQNDWQTPDRHRPNISPENVLASLMSWAEQQKQKK